MNPSLIVMLIGLAFLGVAFIVGGDPAIQPEELWSDERHYETDGE